MTFFTPQWLLLLVIVLPAIWYIGWPRYAFRRRRDIASLLLRTTLVLSVVFALSGLQLVRAVDRQAVIFLVDASDSMGTELLDAQVEYIREAVASKPPDDEWALLLFGADVSIDAPFSTVNEVAPVRSAVLGDQTDLAGAIQTALSLFPADARPRIVVLSDGRETLDSAQNKAQLAQAAGVEISYVLFSREAQPDVRVVDVQTPNRVLSGGEFDVAVTVQASEAADATLLLYANGALIREDAIRLSAGENRYTITQPAGEGGFLNFTAQVVVQGTDAYAQNNRLGAFSQIIGEERILLVAADAADTRNLLPALQSAGFTVDQVAPRNLPQEASALATYRSIVIVNVPAAAFSTAQMERVSSYVRDLGGGLVFVGGENSYAPGGYFETALAEALPVEMRIQDEQRLPRLTIAYLVDRSGSMGASSDGVFTNLQVAQRAITLSIDFLQPTDRAAVITFDSNGTLVAPFQPVADRAGLQRLVNTLRPGGGTDILAGLRTASRFIVDEPSERKHLILITDGGAGSDGLVELVERLNTDFGVTTSVIAIGLSQPPFLADIAEAGAGNYSAAGNAAQIPAILAQETVLATRSFIEEGNFPVIAARSHPTIDGLSQPPNLLGYVATTPRSTAQVILRAPEPNEDPLLASWQYGLGRSVAFTSDATGRWGANWLDWPDFVNFWGQVVQYSITDNAGRNLAAQVILEGDRARLLVDARAEDGDFLNNLALQTSLLFPDGETRQVTLEQVAPGRYEATFDPTTEGAYLLSINGTAPGTDQLFNEVTGWVLSYSPEYAQTEPNEALLSSLADITGGQDLGDDPAAAFALTQEPRTASTPVWPALLLAAALLLPFDVAVRRLIITGSDIRRLRAYLSGSAVQMSDERISSLMSARERARQRTGAGASDEGTIAALRRSRDERTTDKRDGEDDLPPPPEAPPSAPAAPPRTPSGEGDTVSSLLKRRRRERGEDE